MMHLPAEMAWQGLFDGTGRHLGGAYDPVMVDGRLTGTHAVMLSGRPAQRLLFHNVLCTDPYSQLGLVWFMPLARQSAGRGGGYARFPRAHA